MTPWAGFGGKNLPGHRFADRPGCGAGKGVRRRAVGAPRSARRGVGPRRRAASRPVVAELADAERLGSRDGPGDRGKHRPRRQRARWWTGRGTRGPARDPRGAGRPRSIVDARAIGRVHPGRPRSAAMRDLASRRVSGTHRARPSTRGNARVPGSRPPNPAAGGCEATPAPAAPPHRSSPHGRAPPAATRRAALAQRRRPRFPRRPLSPLRASSPPPPGSSPAPAGVPGRSPRRPA